MIETLADGIRVTCSEHGLDRTVEMPARAKNLWNKHLRDQHDVPIATDALPIMFDVAAAARAFLQYVDHHNPDVENAAFHVFGVLVGVDFEADLAFERLTEVARAAVEAGTCVAWLPPC